MKSLLDYTYFQSGKYFKTCKTKVSNTIQLHDTIVWWQILATDLPLLYETFLVVCCNLTALDNLDMSDGRQKKRWIKMTKDKST